MAEVNRWVFTICCGTLLCGIVSILLPSKKMDRLMGLVLGSFMLCCFLIPAGLGLELPGGELPDASSAMEQAAGEVTRYFLEDTARRSEEELTRLAAEELREYGINEEDIQIYIEPDGQKEGGGQGLQVEVRLPGLFRDRDEELQKRLERAFGVAVGLRYRGEGL